MISDNSVYQYYLSPEFYKHIELPSHTLQRHYRFRLANKVWRKAEIQVRDVEELQRWIIKLGGVDIYYSTSRWLNPDKISMKGHSGTYFIADNLLLGNDLIFDIDAKEPITLLKLDKARKSAYNIYKAMEAFPAYEFKSLMFTGYKGFRLVYEDKTPMPSDPKKRLDFIENNRKIFIDRMLKEIKDSYQAVLPYLKQPIFFDRKVTENVMAVIRVPGTVHSATGYIVKIIKPSLLKKKIKDILTHIPFVGKERPGIPEKEDDNGHGDTVSSPAAITRKLVDGSGLTSPTQFQTNYCYYITNRVLGIKKGFVPAFIYQNGQAYANEVKRLQEKYKLGTLYVCQADDKVVVLSLKTMQRRQLQKVLNESTSRSKYTFLRYRRIWIPFSLAFKEKILSKYTGHLSRGHFHYVEIGKRPVGEFCGWPKVELIRAVVE